MPSKVTLRSRFAGLVCIAGAWAAVACSSGGSAGPEDAAITDAANPAAYCAEAGAALEPTASCANAAQTGMTNPFLATARPGCCTGASIGTYCGVPVYSCADSCSSWFERAGQLIGLCALYGEAVERGACVAGAIGDLADASCPPLDAGVDATSPSDASVPPDAPTDGEASEASADATTSRVDAASDGAAPGSDSSSSDATGADAGDSPDGT